MPKTLLNVFPLFFSSTQSFPLGRLETETPSGRSNSKSRALVSFVEVKQSRITINMRMQPFTEEKHLNRNRYYWGLLTLISLILIIGVISYHSSTNNEQDTNMRFELPSDITPNQIHPIYRYKRDENGRRRLITHMVSDTNKSETFFGHKLSQRLFNAFHSASADQQREREHDQHNISRKGHRTQLSVNVFGYTAYTFMCLCVFSSAIPLNGKSSPNQKKSKQPLRYKSNQREWCRVDEPC